MTRAEADITKKWPGNYLNPLVSITCIAYNHEKFIAKAIEGFLMQETNFPFEIIIHDDASTDNTQGIIKEYAEKYPNLIRTILQTENYWLGKGISATTTIVWPSCKGKYIAWCEGDDYWIDANKLQNQTGILESNENISFCFHRALRIFDICRPYEIYPDLQTGFVNSSQLFGLPTIPMVSVVFRNKIDFEFLGNDVQTDFLLLCKLMSNGLGYFLPDVMSVYRKHVDGISYNNQSYNYLKRRVECLHIEAKSTEFTTDVRKEIKRIFKDHTKRLIANYRSELPVLSLLKYRYWLLMV